MTWRSIGPPRGLSDKESPLCHSAPISQRRDSSFLLLAPGGLPCSRPLFTSRTRGAGEASEMDVDARMGAASAADNIFIITAAAASVVPSSVRSPKMIISTPGKPHITAATPIITAALPASTVLTVHRVLTTPPRRPEPPAISRNTIPVMVPTFASGIVVVTAAPPRVVTRVNHRTSTTASTTTTVTSCAAIIAIAAMVIHSRLTRCASHGVGPFVEVAMDSGEVSAS